MAQPALTKQNFENKLVDLQDNMLSFALSLTSDMEEAEDLRQETSLKVLNSQDKFRENSNFKGWVFTIMRNLFLNNYHRLVRTYKIFDTNADLTYMGAHEDSEGLGTPEHEVSLHEINKAIEALNDDLKIPFSLYTSGYKYREISEMLDIPLGTVKSRIFFARKQLQDSLSEYSHVTAKELS
ncbi:MAG: sigma-70 family RNA polymerase sigma factor [Porphyromonas sp.]|nr:sigma-70 family RNA polymerase sigma factor [Porphyromonas sp.]